MVNPSPEPSTSPIQPAVAVVENLEMAPKHPIRRYFARLVDNLIVWMCTFPLWLLLALMLGLTSDITQIKNLLDNYFFNCAMTAISILQMIVVETCLLATWGTTPGKRLLGLQVRYVTGEKLSFQDALQRSATLNGLFFIAAILPLRIIGLVLLQVYQRHKLLKSGYTTWDQSKQIQVGPV
jgi:uncharacterized RDD family membrane protein YckC